MSRLIRKEKRPRGRAGVARKGASVMERQLKELHRCLKQIGRYRINLPYMIFPLYSFLEVGPGGTSLSKEAPPAIFLPKQYQRLVLARALQHPVSRMRGGGDTAHAGAAVAAGD